LAGDFRVKIARRNQDIAVQKQTRGEGGACNRGKKGKGGAPFEKRSVMILKRTRRNERGRDGIRRRGGARPVGGGKGRDQARKRWVRKEERGCTRRGGGGASECKS